MIMAKNKVGNVIHRTHPVCTWPKVALYKGSGDANDAANFTCGIRH
jgi:feruloyl esterase